MKTLTILGSTGSIGTSTLAVVRANPGAFRVVALVAGKNVDVMLQQCREFSPAMSVWPMKVPPPRCASACSSVALVRLR